MSISNKKERLLLLLGRGRMYQRVYATPEGRAVINDILRHCRYGKTPQAFNKHTQSIDPTALAWAGGKTEVAERIIKALGINELEVMNQISQTHAEEKQGVSYYDD